MLEIALSEYAANEDLVSAAAELYTPGHGLEALLWSLPKKNQAYAGAWQSGIIETCKREILAAFLGQAQPAELKAA